jgi:hypothetical protein
MRNVRKLTALALATVGVLAFTSAPAWAGNGYEKVTTTFGSEGSGSGEFKEPTAIAVFDETGNEKVYVLDSGNDRIEWFKVEAGNKYKYEGQFNGSGEYEQTVGGVLKKEKGTAAPTGKFLHPKGIAIDNDPSSPSFGDVYVADGADIEPFAKGHEVVDKFSATGKYEGQLTGTSGEGTGTLENGSTKITEVATETGVFAVGQEITGSGIHAGTTITRLPEPGALEISQAAEATGTSVSLKAHVAFGELMDVAVDAAGDLWVFEGRGPVSEETQATQVDEISDTGSAMETRPFYRGARPILPGFAVDSSGDVFATRAGGEVLGPNGTVTNSANPETTLAIIAANNDLLVDGGSTIELFKSPISADAQPILTFPTTGLSESAGIAVNGGEGDGTIYATQRTADDVDVFAAGAPQQPQIVSAKAKSTSGESGQVEVVVKPGDRKTSVTVEYSRHVSSNGEELEGSIETLNGNEVAAEFGEQTSTASGMEFPNFVATYYYRVTATNSLGTVRSPVYAYTKLPIVAQQHVYEKTSTTALLEATVEPDFSETAYMFEYAETEAALNNGEGTVIHGTLGFFQRKKLEELQKLEEKLEKEEKEEQEGKLPPGTVPPGTLPICPGINEEGGTGTLPESEAATLKCPVSAELSGLVPGRQYYYRVVAQNRVSEYKENANKGDPVRGAIEELKPYAAPAVTTGEPAAITPTSAALSGEVNPEGAPTTYEFAYISEAGYMAAEEAGAANPYAAGETTESRTLSAGETPQPVGPVEATGLLPATTYHYALIATNQYGIQTVGPDQTFTTAAAGTPPTPPSEAGGGLPGSGSPIAVPLSPPPIAFAKVAFPKEEKSSGTTVKTLTNKEKLAKALKTCKKDHSKSKKAKCEAAAHKKYPVASKKKKGKK